MEQADLLRRVIDVLEDQRIVYLLVGSLASGVYGEPRLTADVAGGLPAVAGLDGSANGAGHPRIVDRSRSRCVNWTARNGLTTAQGVETMQVER